MTLGFQIPGQDIHAAVLFGGVIQRNPDGQVGSVVKSYIGTVLMPRKAGPLACAFNHELLVKEHGVFHSADAADVSNALSKQEVLKPREFLVTVAQETARLAQADFVDVAVAAIVNRLVQQVITCAPQEREVLSAERAFEYGIALAAKA